MAHGQFHDPQFDFDAFRQSAGQWAGQGAKRLLLEWQTGPGPTVAWFPAGQRELTTIWHVQVRPTEYNEQYADFLEYRLLPKLQAICRDAGLEPRALCVDQQPILVMRMRRRELERVETQTPGGVAHATNSFGHD